MPTSETKTDFWPSVLSGTLVQRFGVGNLRVGVNVVIHRTDADIARGKNQVRFVHGAHHVHRAQFVRLQLQRIHVHHDLAVFPAVGRRHRGAGNARDLVANLKLQIIVQLRFVEPLAIHREQANGKTRSVHFHHHGRQRAFGKPPQIRHGEVGNVGDVGIGVGAGLKINLDQAHAGHGAGFHMIDAAAQREKSLEGIGDVRFDLFRRHAVVERGHQHDGNIDRRKHVHRHLRQAGNPQDANEKANDDDEVRMAYGKCWHLGLLHSSGFDEFWRNQLAFLELILLAENDGFIFAEAGKYFGVGGSPKPSFTSRLSTSIRGVHHQHGALAASRGFHRLHRDGQNVGHGVQRDLTRAYIPGTSS